MHQGFGAGVQMCLADQPHPAEPGHGGQADIGGNRAVPNGAVTPAFFGDQTKPGMDSGCRDQVGIGLRRQQQGGKALGDQVFSGGQLAQLVAFVLGGLIDQLQPQPIRDVLTPDTQ